MMHINSSTIGRFTAAAFLLFLFVSFLFFCDNTTDPTDDNSAAVQDSTQDTTTLDDSITGIAVTDTINMSDSLDTLSMLITSNPDYSFEWSTYAWNTWITATDSGSEGDSLTIIIDRNSKDLSTGWNQGWFQINTFHDSLESKKVYISVMKLGEGDPKLSVACAITDFGVKHDSLYCSVANDSGGKLIWQAETPLWINMVPDSGVYGENHIRLYALRDSLEAGIYIDSIRFTSNGGDTSISVSINIPADTSAASITEYWPLGKGNRWVWVDPYRTSWWAIEVTDSFSREGNTVWELRADDSQGGYGEYYATVVSTSAGDIFTLTADSSKLADVSYGSYADCSMIECWSGSYVFGLFALPIQAGSINDPYWRCASSYIAGSLEDLMSNYSIWANDSADISDLAISSNDTCMGIKEDAASKNELYTILGKGSGPLIWDGYTLEYCKIDGQEHGELPDIQPQHFAVNDDSTSDLLYWFQNDDGSHIYYLGYRYGGMPVPNHIVFEDENGEVAGTIFMRADFIPVMWVCDTVTIGIHNTSAFDSLAQDSAFDPAHAYHMTLLNDKQVDFFADIYPHDINEVLDSLEWMFDSWLTHLKDELDSMGVQSYNDLLALAYIDWDQRERYQVMASFIAMGAAMVAYDMDTASIEIAEPDTSQGLSKKAGGPYIPSPFIPDRVKEMAKKTAEYLKEELECKYCPKPGVPTVSMLQCQGLKAVLWSGQICHDSFMPNTSASRCLNLCHVSTMCFTNICMPREVGVAEVEDVLFENDLEVTPDEIRDLVQQNVDNFKPLVE